MKFLIDNNLSPLLAEGLRAAGHEAMHLRDINMRDAPDPAVLEYLAPSNAYLSRPIPTSVLCLRAHERPSRLSS